MHSNSAAHYLELKLRIVPLTGVGCHSTLSKFPIPTGKTSVVKYLAALTGTTVVRVNNHEHTDLQEYVGSYCVNELDKLAFKEGNTIPHFCWDSGGPAT